MKKYRDISGRRYGKLVVKEYHSTDKNRNALFLCDCDCGNTAIVAGTRLVSGHTQSCGCLQKETARTELKKFNQSDRHITDGHLIHGENKTPLHNVWVGMRKRCNNQSYEHYGRYGGRGIKVCAEWYSSYLAFKSWALANGYVEGLEIDRIDNDGNYEPSNCKWSTRTEQVRNRSNTRFIGINGIVKPLKQWCEETGTNYKVAHAKIQKGCDPAYAVGLTYIETRLNK